MTNAAVKGMQQNATSGPHRNQRVLGPPRQPAAVRLSRHRLWVGEQRAKASVSRRCWWVPL